LLPAAFSFGAHFIEGRGAITKAILARLKAQPGTNGHVLALYKAGRVGRESSPARDVQYEKYGEDCAGTGNAPSRKSDSGPARSRDIGCSLGHAAPPASMAVFVLCY
jgi:hypothetical protein